MDPSERYSYLFRAGNHRFLFIRNYGAGTQSQAQLVQDIDSGENLIRKVTTHRLVPFKGNDSDPNWRPRQPREVRILRIIRKSFQPPEPGLTPYLAECYGHEYIKSASVDHLGRTKYHSVSYWKLYNGQSLRYRWLSGEILPPSIAVARMIRQFLSTLHYLYTAGLQPVYHEDTHFDNIWAHWDTSPNNTALPDFYLGDFADASQDGSKFASLSLAEKKLLARPVNDLDKFCSQLDLLLDILGEKRGYGDERVRLLRELAQEIWKVVGDWKRAADTDAPPDLTGLISCAVELEEGFGEGGALDETRTRVYERYVIEERKLAREVEGERGLVVVRASVEEALRPTGLDGLKLVPMAIHGPWQLVWADSLAPVEGGGVMHHRPNGGRGRYDEVLPDLNKGKIKFGLFSKKDMETFGLSDSAKRPGMYDGGYLDEYSEGEVSDGPYTPLFQSEPEPESPPEPSFPWDSASDPQSESSSQDPSPTLSFTPGDDAAFCHRSPETTAEESSPPSFGGSNREPSSELFLLHGDDAPRHHPVEDMADESPQPSSPDSTSQVSSLDLGVKESSPEPQPQVAEKLVPRWASAQEPQFYVKGLFGMEGLRDEDIENFDMQQFQDQCEGRFRYEREVYDKTAAELESKKQAEQAEEASPSPPERFEQRFMRWHMLIHGIDCKCNRWADDVEAILRVERTRRTLTGFRGVNLSLEDPELTFSE